MSIRKGYLIDFFCFVEIMSLVCTCYMCARANVELRHCVVILIIMTSRGSRNCERLTDLSIETREITLLHKEHSLLYI